MKSKPAEFNGNKHLFLMLQIFNIMKVSHGTKKVIHENITIQEESIKAKKHIKAVLTALPLQFVVNDTQQS